MRHAESNTPRAIDPIAPDTDMWQNYLPPDKADWKDQINESRRQLADIVFCVDGWTDRQLGRQTLFCLIAVPS